MKKTQTDPNPAVRSVRFFRQKTIFRLILRGCIWPIFILFFVLPVSGAPEPRKVHFLYLRDFAGEWGKQKDGSGGAANLDALIREKRQSARLRGETAILVHQGRIWDPHQTGDFPALWRNQKVLNRLGVEVAGVSKTELHLQSPRLRALWRQRSYPFVLSNLELKPGGAAALWRDRPVPFYIWHPPGGVKTGFLSVVSPRDLPNHPGLRLTNPLLRLRALIPELKKKGCQLIVVLSDLDFPQPGRQTAGPRQATLPGAGAESPAGSVNNLVLARTLPEVDLILAGPGGEQNGLRYFGGTVVLNGGGGTQHLASVSWRGHTNGTTLGWEGHRFAINPAGDGNFPGRYIAATPAMDNWLESARRKRNWLDRPRLRLKNNLAGWDAQSGFSPLGQWMATRLSQALAGKPTILPNKLENGDLRGGQLVSVGKIRSLLPLHDQPYQISLYGHQIPSLLAGLLNRPDLPHSNNPDTPVEYKPSLTRPARSWPLLAGIQADVWQPPGKPPGRWRVGSVRVQGQLVQKYNIYNIIVPARWLEPAGYLRRWGRLLEPPRPAAAISIADLVAGAGNQKIREEGSPGIFVPKSPWNITDPPAREKKKPAESSENPPVVDGENEKPKNNSNTPESGEEGGA